MNLNQKLALRQAAVRAVAEKAAESPVRKRSIFLPSEDTAPPPEAVEAPPASLSDKLRTRAAAVEPLVYAEIERICSLEIEEMPDDEQLEDISRRHVLAEKFEAGWRLFRPQAAALDAYDRHGGLFAPIAVGWGKTLITLRIASMAYAKGIKRILLLMPSQVYTQLIKRDIEWARQHVPLGVPFVYMGRTTQERRRALSRKKQGCFLLPYSCLSTRDTEDVLEAMDPQLILADEVHKLRNPRAACSRRIRKFVDSRRPQFCGLSGTITSKSVMDYYHLMRSALGDNCPLPLAKNVAHEWGSALDSGAMPSQAQTGPILPLVDWAQGNFEIGELSRDVTGFRTAYRLRLNSAPGVVASGDDEIGVSLVMKQEHVVGEGPDYDKLRDLVLDVETLWVTPDGDELEHAMLKWKWMFELSSGFYNQLYWPEAEWVVGHGAARAATLKDAEDDLELAKAHHKLHQVYARELRGWLQLHARKGIDTPMLVGANMATHGARDVTRVLYQAWTEQREARFDGMPERQSRAVRVCDYKLKAAVKWAHQHVTHGAILWVHSKEIGIWLTELLAAEGLDPLHCPAGNKANSEIIDPDNANRIVVASITAHGTGKNLQHFSEQYVVQWPRHAPAAEQLLGRTHRNGQQADELIVHYSHNSTFDELQLAACLVDAVYIHQSTGVRQKVVIASYDPLPAVYPPEFLREQGLENRLLSIDASTFLAEKFAVTPAKP